MVSNQHSIGGGGFIRGMGSYFFVVVVKNGGVIRGNTVVLVYTFSGQCLDSPVTATGAQETTRTLVLNVL